MRDKAKKAARKKRYREEHREEIAAYARRYQAEHREERNARSRRYSEEHREEAQERSKKWREEHPEQAAATARRWYIKNTEITKARTKRRGVISSVYVAHHKATHPCVDCGVTERPCSHCGLSASLEFHHIDPTIKRRGVATLVSEGRGVAMIQEEIDLCVVLCVACHKRRHYGGER